MRSYGPAAPLVGGHLVASLGALALAGIGVSAHAVVLAGPLFVIGLGAGAVTTPAMSLSEFSTPSTAAESGLASGLLNGARQTGGVIGVALLGALLGEPATLARRPIRISCRRRLACAGRHHGAFGVAAGEVREPCPRWQRIASRSRPSERTQGLRNHPAGHKHIPGGRSKRSRTDMFGDVGDFVKLALLRALSPGHRLGVVSVSGSRPSRITATAGISAISKTDEWRHLDPEVFDSLARGSWQSASARCAALESAALLHRCRFVIRAACSADGICRARHQQGPNGSTGPQGRSAIAIWSSSIPTMACSPRDFVPPARKRTRAQASPI